MATINGVTFNMQSLRPVAVHRNSVSEQPGSDTNFITDMGYDGLVLRLEGFEETLATYDSVISEFMKSGEQTLIHRTGWQFEVYSAQLTPELIRGFADNYFPYDLILYTSTPYRESTTLSCRAQSITANNQEWSAEDMPCNNLLDNWSFEDWSAGPTGHPPAGWIELRNAANYPERSSTYKFGAYSANIRWDGITGSNSAIYISITDYLLYEGKYVTFQCWVKASSASKIKLAVNDGSLDSSSYNTGTDWELLSLTSLVKANPDFLQFVIYTYDDTGDSFIDGAVAVEGDSIPDNTFIRDIDTDGSVDAVPDIKITGGAIGATFGREGGFLNTETDATEFGTTSESWVLKETYTYTADLNRGWILDTVGCKVKSTGAVSTGYAKFTYTAASLNGGAETDVPGGSFSQYGSSWSALQSVTDLDIVCAGNENLVVKLYCKSSSTGQTGASKDQNIRRGTTRKYACTSPVIYNIADTTVKSEVANEIELDTIVRINTDGTGTVTYADDFTTDKYLDAAFIHESETYDDPNNELDLANDGYITYKIDTKYPITGIPIHTATIDIDTGTPTIEISSDGSTFYPIDTAIVDNVSTEYPLDDSDNLSLKGLTTFYLKLDCDGSSTCSLTTFSLSIDITTIDVEHPIVSAAGVSTFRCDQHADSGLQATVALIYRDRSWPA